MYLIKRVTRYDIGSLHFENRILRDLLYAQVVTRLLSKVLGLSVGTLGFPVQYFSLYTLRPSSSANGSTLRSPTAATVALPSIRDFAV